MRLLNEAEILARLHSADGEWKPMPNDFPENMTAIEGMVGQDRWLVVEHTPFEGQNVDKGYDGTLTIFPTTFYRLTYDVAKAAFLKGKAWLDKQPKKTD
jgi:hypothetical protein